MPRFRPEVSCPPFREEGGRGKGKRKVGFAGLKMKMPSALSVCAPAEIAKGSRCCL